MARPSRPGSSHFRAERTIGCPHGEAADKTGASAAAGLNRSGPSSYAASFREFHDRTTPKSHGDTSIPRHAYWVALCTSPPDKAEEIANELSRRRVCACVNVIPGLTSVYEWKGEVERDSESQLVIKTRADRFADLQAAVAGLHPCEVFERVALPVERDNAGYLSWIDSLLPADSAT